MEHSIEAAPYICTLSRNPCNILQRASCTLRDSILTEPALYSQASLKQVDSVVSSRQVQVVRFSYRR